MHSICRNTNEIQVQNKLQKVLSWIQSSIISADVRKHDFVVQTVRMGILVQLFNSKFWSTKFVKHVSPSGRIYRLNKCQIRDEGDHKIICIELFGLDVAEISILSIPRAKLLFFSMWWISTSCITEKCIHWCICKYYM